MLLLSPLIERKRIEKEKERGNLVKYKTVGTLLVICTVSLLVIGLAILFSTSSVNNDARMIAKQLFWIGLGSSLIFGMQFFDYRKLIRKISWIPVAVTFLMLLYLFSGWVLMKTGILYGPGQAELPLIHPIKGAFRWIILGPLKISIQPSEFAKLALIIFIADYFNRNSRRVNSLWKGYLRPMTIAGSVVLLIVLGKDLSTGVITATIVYTMAFIAGCRGRDLIVTAVLGISLAVGFIVTDSERISRITSFRNPEATSDGDGYQLNRSRFALGSGGLKGRGFSKSQMKQGYLPDANTDFIIAILGEEFGFLGTVAVTLCYLSLVLTCFWVAAIAVDKTGLLLAAGIGASFGLHAFVNIGVVSGFIPTTGVTAPLISYGGSNALVSLLCIGVIINVLRVAEREGSEQEGMNTLVRINRRKSTRESALAPG